MSKLAEGIGAVLFLMVNDPRSVFLARPRVTPSIDENEARILAHFDREMEHVERVAKDPDFIAAHYGAGDFDADALRAKAQEAQPRTRICPACFLVLNRCDTSCTCGAKLPRLRDRVRSPKLYACDIEAGGEYVPKRGNDKTPNYYVVATTDVEGITDRVWYRRMNESDANAVHPTGHAVADFLALVSRRVGA